MVVGSMSARLLIREARTLKDKRQVLQSIRTRLKNEFNVSVAEVAGLDHRQLAVIGFAMVASEAHAIKTTFGRILEALRRHPIAELLDHEMETY